MIKRIFAVYDNKGECYLTPIFEITTGSATRSFADAVNTPDHPFGRHPNDFALFEIATWDDSDANIIRHLQPIHVAEAIQFINIARVPTTEPSLFDSETGELK